MQEPGAPPPRAPTETGGAAPRAEQQLQLSLRAFPGRARAPVPAGRARRLQPALLEGICKASGSGHLKWDRPAAVTAQGASGDLLALYR